MDETIALESAEDARARGRLGPGAKVGRYQVLELIGEGGMGAVYAAYDPELDRRVALKLLHRAVDRDSASRGRQRLTREAQAMARLSHPNVITVHDVGTFEGAVFVAMEFIAGQTLRAWMEAEERSLPELVDVFARAGEGLSAAHEAGLIHRDFKPENVMVGDDGRVRVLDFGLARPDREDTKELAAPSTTSGSFGVTFDEALTADGQLMGTPAYMAPEQNRGESVDARCDQFSFSVAVYEAVYGERPFVGESASAVRTAILQGVVRDAPEGSDVPASLRAVLLRGLSRERDERYPVLRDLLEALRKVVAVSSGGRARWVAVSVVVGLATAGAVWSARGEPPTPDADPCVVASDELAGAWDETRKAAVSERFEESGLRSAPVMAKRVATRLDRYAARWREERYAACAATRIAKSQSDELMDLRMTCLGRAKNKLGAFVDLLAESDAATVERAEDVAKALGPLSACADTEGLRQILSPPEDGPTATAVEEVRNELDIVAANVAAGRYPKAFEISKAATERARSIDYPPLLAEALVRWGELQARRGDNDGSIESYNEALYLSIELGAARTELKVRLDLTFVYAQLAPDLDAATHWGRSAQALARRLDLSNELANAYRYEGVAFAVNAKLEEAQARYLRAREVVDAGRSADVEKTALLRIFLDQDLFRVQRRLGQFEVARETSQRSLAGMEELFGRDHPTTVQFIAELAYLDVEDGDVGEAVAPIRESLRVVTEVHGENHPRAMLAARQLAEVLWKAGKTRDAEKLARDVIARSEAHLGAEHRSVGTACDQLAGWLRDDKRFGEAIELYEKAIELYTNSGGVADTAGLDDRVHRIRSLVAARRADEALVTARTDLEALPGDIDPLMRARAEFYVVVAEAAAGEVDPASVARARELHAMWAEEKADDADTQAMKEWLSARE